MRKILLIITALIMGLSASAASLIEQADSAYNSKDFKNAVKLYHQAIDRDGVSPVAYYNLGNAYYRIGRLGRAVLYYERALKLDPSFGDARENLKFVNTKIQDKPEDDSSFLGNLHLNIRSIMSPNAWAWTAFALFVIIIGAIALYIFSGSIAMRKVGFFGGIVVAVIFLYAFIQAYQSSAAFGSHDTAVITVPAANMSTSPGNSNAKDAKIIPVHEGTVVQIVDSMAIPGDPSVPLWYDVKINNSTRAWVRSTEIEKI